MQPPVRINASTVVFSQMFFWVEFRKFFTTNSSTVFFCFGGFTITLKSGCIHLKRHDVVFLGRCVFLC